MDLQKLLQDAREREMDIGLEFDRRTEQYKRKVLENDEIRRQLKVEEDELKALIPKEPYEKDGEWAKVLEEIRTLERLIERGGQDG